MNKGNEEYTRVVVDAEHYRAKREKTLESLAYRLANKVVKTRRSVKLEPMNPYERKVIHAALHNHPKVSTRSEGQDPYRRVIIELDVYKRQIVERVEGMEKFFLSAFFSL